MTLRPLLWIVLLTFASSQVHAQSELVEKKLLVPGKFQSLFKTEHSIHIPKVFRLSMFYASNIAGLRFMQFDPEGRLCVASTSANEVLALSDKDTDGVADTAIVLASNTLGAHSFAFHDSGLYVASRARVMRYSNPDKFGEYQTSTTFIGNIPDSQQENGPNHITRTILFDDVRQKVFLSVGAPCNACREADTDRAAIWELNQDGTGKKIFASGLRNAVGLALDSNNIIWATVAERNSQSADIPGELVTSIKPDGFYGWPLAFGDHQFENFAATAEYTALLPITRADSLLVKNMQPPDATLPAHCTPLGIAYYRDTTLPTYYRNCFFVAEHGSYNGTDGRLVANGSKIILLRNISGVWTPEDFITGFLTDSINYKRWARPTGLLFDRKGNFYFASDNGDSNTPNAIFKVSYHPEDAVEESAPDNTATIDILDGKLRIVSSEDATITITDILGRQYSAASCIALQPQSIELRSLPRGLDFIILRSKSGVTIRRIFLH